MAALLAHATQLRALHATLALLDPQMAAALHAHLQAATSAAPAGDARQRAASEPVDARHGQQQRAGDAGVGDVAHGRRGVAVGVHVGDPFAVEQTSGQSGAQSLGGDHRRARNNHDDASLN